MVCDTTAAAVGVCLHKGGVGKSTLTRHLGAALARLDVRVLLWDLDPAGGLTAHCGLEPDLVGSFEVLTRQLPARDVVRSWAHEPSFPRGVDLIPSSVSLLRLDEELARRDAYTRPWQSLAAPLAEVRSWGAYDVVLFDTAPSLVTPTRAVYLAADSVLTVATPSRASAEGLARTLEEIRQVQRPDLNPALRVLGLVLGRVDSRRTSSRQYPAEFEAQLAASGLPGALFATQVPERAAVEAARQIGKTVFETAARDAAAVAYHALALEVGLRLGLAGARAAAEQPLSVA